MSSAWQPHNSSVTWKLFVGAHEGSRVISSPSVTARDKYSLCQPFSHPLSWQVDGEGQIWEEAFPHVLPMCYRLANWGDKGKMRSLKGEQTSAYDKARIIAMGSMSVLGEFRFKINIAG